MFTNTTLFYLEAKTAKELAEKMLKNNLENNRVFQYEAPMFADGMFYVWYPVTMEELSKQLKVKVLAKDKIKNDAVKSTKSKTKTGKK